MAAAAGLFWEGLARHGRSTALVDAVSGRRWSYTELARAVEALAARLGGERRLLFLLCRNDARTVVAWLAALVSGQPVALLDARLDPSLLRPLLAAYQPELIAGPLPPEIAADLAAADAVTPVEGLELRSLEGGGGALHSDLALLLSTSGTTGSPKFVRLSRGAVAANTASIIEGLEIAPDQTAISSLPIHYSYGLSVLNTHLAVGAAVVLTDESLIAEGFWRAFRDGVCTSIAAVPYGYQMLRRLDLDALAVPTLRVMTQAGGKLADPLIAEFHGRMTRRGGRFYVMYGQTEATARITILPWDLLPEKLGSAGRAIAGGKLSIASDDAPDGEAESPPGTVGEVIYRGPNVMMGYALSRPDLARGDELSGCLRTGDIGYLDDDGLLFVTGRSRRIAKVFGLRVNLDEVEALARRHVACAAVAGPERVILFCETGDGIRVDSLRVELSRVLRVNQAAFDLRHLERLPLQASGKIDYRALERAV
jgi:acyl-CoA synthetase (AMP-forming)/AMP-acid ligase II